jgi:hypothetical protein
VCCGGVEAAWTFGSMRRVVPGRGPPGVPADEAHVDVQRTRNAKVVGSRPIVGSKVMQPAEVSPTEAMTVMNAMVEERER